ncbi:hypothetical protein GYB59_14705 [bacterium]|nr:hypothetical protein [bacterium]
MPKRASFLPGPNAAQTSGFSEKIELILKIDFAERENTGRIKGREKRGKGGCLQQLPEGSQACRPERLERAGLAFTRELTQWIRLCGINSALE